MTRALIFDMDGTIFDSEGLHHEAEKKVLEKRDVRFALSDWEGCTGLKSNAIFQRFIDKYSIDASAEELVDEKVVIYNEIASSRVKMLPGFHELLKRAEGYKLALVTSSPAGIARTVLERFGLTKTFSLVVTGGQVRNGKPHPEPYDLAVKRIGVPAQSCIVLEDAVNGVRSAKAAGCKAIGITNSFLAEDLRAAGADEVVAGFDEISREMLDRLVS